MSFHAKVSIYTHSWFFLISQRYTKFSVEICWFIKDTVTWIKMVFPQNIPFIYESLWNLKEERKEAWSVKSAFSTNKWQFNSTLLHFNANLSSASVAVLLLSSFIPSKGIINKSSIYITGRPDLYPWLRCSSPEWKVSFLRFILKIHYICLARLRIYSQICL